MMYGVAKLDARAVLLAGRESQMNTRAAKMVATQPALLRRSVRRGFDSPEVSIFVAVVITFVTFTALEPSMAEPDNVVRILRQSTFFGIVALGFILLLMAGEIDLSTGSVAGLSSAISGSLIVDHGWGELASYGTAILVAAAIGLVTSVVVLRIGVPSFFATLAMHFVVLGLIIVLLGGQWIFVRNETPKLDRIASSGPFLDLPWVFFIWLGAALVLDLLVRRSKLGAILIATGSNPRAAEVAGINTAAVKTAGFVLVSVLSAIAGILVMHRGGVADQLTGDGWLLWIIAIAILGGGSIGGGVGSVAGVFLAAILAWIIKLGLSAVTLPANAQEVVVGGILIGAAAMDVARRRAWAG